MIFRGALNAVDPSISGVLIRGAPGTGKSTAVRSLADLLPTIEVHEGCAFNCDPKRPEEFCSYCKELRGREGLRVITRPTSIVTVPIGATEDRLLGTLDLEAALNKGRRELSPGLLARVHRGFLYLDEVNLIADHLLDAILDAASSGIHRLERDGLSATHPSRFALIGTMNPSEGALRPQIVDRFGLCVDVDSILDPLLRAEVLARQLDRLSVANGGAHSGGSDCQLAQLIYQARAVLRSVRQPDSALLAQICSISSRLRVVSHRADLVILRTAMAYAALRLHTELSHTDIAIAAMLALQHRVSDSSELAAVVREELLSDSSFDDIEELLSDSVEPWRRILGDPPTGDEVDGDEPRDGPTGAESNPLTSAEAGKSGIQQRGKVPKSQPLCGAEADAAAQASVPEIEQLRPQSEYPYVGYLARCDMRMPLLKHGASGGHSGRNVRGSQGPLAILPSLILETARSLTRAPGDGQHLPLRPRMSDIYRRLRVGRPNVGRVIVLDASWSMAMDGLFSRARGMVADLLDAHRRGDRASLVVAGGDRARVLAFSERYAQTVLDLVQRLRPRGQTPMLDGIDAAMSLCRNRWAFPACAAVIVFVITDGAPSQRGLNVSSKRLIATTARELHVPGVIFALRTRSDTDLLQWASLELGWQVHAVEPRV